MNSRLSQRLSHNSRLVKLKTEPKMNEGMQKSCQPIQSAKTDNQSTKKKRKFNIEIDAGKHSTVSYLPENNLLNIASALISPAKTYSFKTLTTPLSSISLSKYVRKSA